MTNIKTLAKIADNSFSAFADTMPPGVDIFAAGSAMRQHCFRLIRDAVAPLIGHYTIADAVEAYKAVHGTDDDGALSWVLEDYICQAAPASHADVLAQAKMLNFAVMQDTSDDALWLPFSDENAVSLTRQVSFFAVAFIGGKPDSVSYAEMGRSFAEWSDKHYLPANPAMLKIEVATANDDERIKEAERRVAISSQPIPETSPETSDPSLYDKARWYTRGYLDAARDGAYIEGGELRTRNVASDDDKPKH